MALSTVALVYCRAINWFDGSTAFYFWKQAVRNFFEFASRMCYVCTIFHILF